ncbi:hypothetical protein [Streptomyces viridochromogenes]|jgi:hypothetical protein|uniref:hypothetical protein n=1 Tax=Streptomyces viridochromogenes TaxID=1938 RepID=UPI00069D65DD|nr:hypothetical protein [Streptomyces viridochromogenes]KOG21814.1 hypothetical protein ADK36_12635 [Streptomyces viridochromogenes]
MAAVLNSIEFQGLPEGGGDPVAVLSISPPSFQAGQQVTDEFIAYVEAFIAGQQNVASVKVTKFETVSTVI